MIEFMDLDNIITIPYLLLKFPVVNFLIGNVNELLLGCLSMDHYPQDAVEKRVCEKVKTDGT
jgi:hypothetical protein